MKYNVAQVIGLNTDQKAAQVVSSNQDGESIFLAVLSLTCDDAFTKGRQFLSETSDYYLDAPGSPADKINATFKQAADKLKDISESFDLVLAAVSGKILYLISDGKTEVFLKRGNRLSSLLSLGTSNQLISGFLEDGDKILFATNSLVVFLGEDLSKTLDLGVEVFEEEISSKIAAASLDQESLAGLLLQINDEDKMDIPVLPESQQTQESLIQKQELFPKKLLFGKLLPILAFIKTGFPGNGRARLIVGVILIVILLLGIGFKYKSNQDRQKMLVFNQVLLKARNDFNQAQSIQGLNVSQAQKGLESAKNNVNQALILQPGNQEALNLKKQIEDNSASILQKFATSNFPVFLDLELVKKNFHAQNLSLNSGNLLLLDPGTKSLITINIAKKSNQILAGSDQIGEATLASINGGLAFVYSKDKGVLRIDITNQKQVIVGKKDSELGNVADIYGFSGNVYLLDTANPSTGSGQVWKYLPTSEGYSDKREYLSKDAKVDFTNSLRMQIESSIYVLKKGGEILRFTKGEKDHFSLGGLDKGVKDPKSFFVSSDTDNLYLLDSGNSRLLVLSKTGEFKGQYQGDKFATASDLVVDETGKKVYLLEAGKIYTADLK